MRSRVPKYTKARSWIPSRASQSIRQCHRPRRKSDASWNRRCTEQADSVTADGDQYGRASPALSKSHMRASTRVRVVVPPNFSQGPPWTSGTIDSRSLEPSSSPLDLALRLFSFLLCERRLKYHMARARIRTAVLK